MILLAFVMLGTGSSSAFAGTAEEINALPILDGLNRSESPLSNSGKWSALAWDTSASGVNTGRVTATGWGPYDAFSTVNGAYWNPATFKDSPGDAAAITMATGPGVAERYVALWLDMSSPGSAKTGYQLRWTAVSGTTYSVSLSKWSAGTEAVLASNASVSIPTGSTLAISDTGGTVTAWQGTGGSLASLLSASDSTFASGYAGVEGSGSNSRFAAFKAGALIPPPDTTISGGPKGTVVPNVLISFTGTGSPTGFECSLDAGAYASCTSPNPFTGLSEGTHTVRVRAVNGGGPDQTPAERSFQVVDAAKAVSKVGILDNFERSEVPLATGKFTKTSWAAAIGGTWIGTYRGFGSSSGLAGTYWNPGGFSDGEGTVLISGVVGTGATSAGQYLGLWLGMPEPGSIRSGYEARFTGVNGTATNYTVELSKWVGGARTVLASTTGFSLAVGTTMALTETAGGRITIWTGTSALSPVLSANDTTYTSGYAGLEVNGGAGTIYNFRAGRIDLQAPDTSITSGPSGSVLPSEVSFAFSSTEAGSSFECLLDGGSYASCASPKVYSGPAAGSHNFKVRASDNVGNQDPTPAERSFEVIPPPAVTTTAATAVKATQATLNGTVNPKGAATTYQFEYGPTTSYGSKAPASPKSAGSGGAAVVASEGISGLTAGTAYHYRLVATNGAGTSKGEDQTFTTAAAPLAATEAATVLSANEGTLNATVNPKGAATTYQFEYGPTGSYGTKVPASAKAIGSGYSAVSVSTPLSGLAEHATYHFRVVATNEVGTVFGQDRTFDTLLMPEAQTEAATPIEANEAILEGTVDPNGSESSYKFQYGTTAAYGQESAGGFEELEAPNEESELAEPLAHLKPGTTYHYRLVATSAAGTDYGVDRTVATGPAQVSAQQEAEEEQEELNFTGRFTPPPGSEFAGLHQHGDSAVQAHDAPMNAVKHSGARWLRVFINSMSRPTLEEIFVKAANREIHILPYMDVGLPAPGSTAEKDRRDYLVAAIDRFGPKGTLWSQGATDGGLKINNPMPAYTWEIGNEPNRGEEVMEAGGHVQPVAYGNYFANLSGAAKATANIQVLLSGLYTVDATKNGADCDPEKGNCVMTVDEFIREMKHVDSYDAISLHPYEFKVHGGAPTSKDDKRAIVDRIHGDLTKARQTLIDMKEGNKSIWVTEFGFPTDYGASKDTENKTVPAVSESTQRDLIEMTFNRVKANRTDLNIAHLFYFNLQNYTDPGVPPKWPFGNGLRKISGKKKEGWRGFAIQANGDPNWPPPAKAKKHAPRLIGSSHADVVATLDTDGSDATYYFQYRKAQTTTWINSALGSAQAIEGDQDVDGTLTGLTPEQPYEYRAIATNEDEATTVGEVQLLTTEPTVAVTGTVTETLNGEPGWASVAGWVKVDGIGLAHGKVNINFRRKEPNGEFVPVQANSHEVDVVNGQYHYDYAGLGRGTWDTRTVFYPQQGLPEKASQYREFTIKTGYKLIAKHSGKCLDVNNGSTGNGAPMIQYQCGDPNAALNQIFALVPQPGPVGHYALVARHSNRCVSVTAGSQSQGVQLNQWDCLGQPHQIWHGETVEPNGPDNVWGHFIADSSNQCMEVQASSQANGGIVDQYGCAGSQANQLWTYQSVEANQVPTQTFWTIDQNDTFHGMPGFVSFHGRVEANGAAYPLAGRSVHIIFERLNAQGGYDPVPGEEYVAALNAAGEYSARYWGIGHDTWHIRAVFYGNGDALAKSESPIHTVEIKSGYRLMFRNSKKCLSTKENGTANTTWLIQWTCNSTNNPYDGQTFSVYPVDTPGANHWQLRPNTASGKCVDVYGAITGNGAPLDIYQCIPGATNQIWSFPELASQPGWFGGVAQHSNRCMDVTGNNPENGVQMEQYDCIWSGNQQFTWLVVP